MKVKKQFILTIEVDEEAVIKKYPNYRYNFNNPKELIKSIVDDIVFIAGIDMSKKGMTEWGYSIKIKEKKS